MKGVAVLPNGIFIVRRNNFQSRLIKYRAQRDLLVARSTMKGVTREKESDLHCLLCGVFVCLS